MYLTRLKARQILSRLVKTFKTRTQELYTELNNYTRNLIRTQPYVAHDSIGCIKLLNRDLLYTVNIIENHLGELWISPRQPTTTSTIKCFLESVSGIVRHIHVSLAYVGYSFVATRKSLKSVANEPDEFKL